MSFQFKIDEIQSAPNAPSEHFANGDYKPPIERHHYRPLRTTQWLQWRPDGLSIAVEPPQPTDSYSTSVFYDGHSSHRFLFFPDDCRAVNIIDLEQEHTERWGSWRQLCFTHKAPNHSVLDHDGEHNKLSGQPGSYSPVLLPSCYRSPDHGTLCGLSGKMSLLIALTTFSCSSQHMLNAITRRLKLGERRWINYQIQAWGSGR